ncbi:Ycf66 family protein [Leptothoe spongobia]|uniref:Ycf66 family protein n=1 Tax=Leptothoe spongobia TAU-MAC 1115 TaxID=1967444 RepID=A0A947DG86_9CYAN|nr:Ycf66 family protein [Leptothoe spongobia]MBT9316493.1 hypothetical protein [Leptothoe spongobia TAU-MAC 1115]
MLANLLAVVIGLGSLGFYLVAFILPEVHRRSDFFWSGVGMFYAVVLWYCARQMHGAVLLGQTASVGLLLWLGYQTLLLRRETTPAAQQTPIRLGKSERDRVNGGTSRPIAKDYEFVEDGVEDALDAEPDPDSPILIKPTADEFALKMVVPAAMPKPTIEENILEDVPSAEPLTPSDQAQKREKTNPFAVVGIFAGWIKEIVTPKKKEPKPMIDLPPRPPSISKTDSKTDTAVETTNLWETDTSENSAPPPDNGQPEVTVANVDTSPDISPTSSVNATSEDQSTSEHLESTIATPAPAETPKPLSAMPQQDDDGEDSNWPEDEFWD